MESVGFIVARAGGVLTIASDPDVAEIMLGSDDYLLKVIDHASRGAIPRPSPKCDTCPLVRAVATPDDIVLLAPRGAAGGCRLRGHVYPRRALDVLLADIAAYLPSPIDLDGPDAILGGTPVIHLVRDQVRAVAPYHDVSVLILGETGTGKELVAQSIHRLGKEPSLPFVALNCAAIPEHLFESELFGHEAGAYTGARAARVGLLEAAEGGTVFLDEIAEMPIQIQPKLLRVLETRTFRRLGSNRDVTLKARVISATNRGLAGFSRAHLRADLLYRLAGFTITLPSLRERVADIDLLAHSFLRAFRERHGATPLRFSRPALELLQAQAWPGNVRELRALVEHSAILAKDDPISDADIHRSLARLPRARMSTRPPAPLPDARSETGIVISEVVPASSPRSSGLRDVERDMILAAYEQSAKNLSRAAKSLAIPRSTLRDKLRRYGAL
ncbi:MAG TPA: sigma-54 dependent transcriptional regulator [Polyangiaceae bacterium]